MDRHRVKGFWNKAKGAIKKSFGRLTGDRKTDGLVDPVCNQGGHADNGCQMAALSHSVRLDTAGRVRFRGVTVMTYGPVGVLFVITLLFACWLVVSHDHRTSWSPSCADVGCPSLY